MGNLKKRSSCEKAKNLTLPLQNCKETQTGTQEGNRM
jgi:hypothetical protein